MLKKDNGTVTAEQSKLDEEKNNGVDEPASRSGSLKRPTNRVLPQPSVGTLSHNPR